MWKCFMWLSGLEEDSAQFIKSAWKKILLEKALAFLCFFFPFFSLETMKGNVVLVVSVSQALGAAINHPVVVTVAVQFLLWPLAHSKCCLSHSPPARRITASPLYFSGPSQFVAAPLSSANDNVSLAPVMIAYMPPPVRKSPCLIIHKRNIPSSFSFFTSSMTSTCG